MPPLASEACPFPAICAKTAERAAENEPATGLGRELEKLAIDALAVAALGRIRARAAAAGADRITPAAISGAIKGTRAARK